MKQFVATRKVPKADSHDLEFLTFGVPVLAAEVITQIQGSISLIWRLEDSDGVVSILKSLTCIQPSAQAVVESNAITSDSRGIDSTAP